MYVRIFGSDSTGVAAGAEIACSAVSSEVYLAANASSQKKKKNAPGWGRAIFDSTDYFFFFFFLACVRIQYKGRKLNAKLILFAD